MYCYESCEGWDVVSDDWNYNCDRQRCSYYTNGNTLIGVDVSIVDKINIMLCKCEFNKKNKRIVFVNNKRAEFIFIGHRYEDILEKITYEEMIELIENEKIDIDSYMVCKKLTC